MNNATPILKFWAARINTTTEVRVLMIINILFVCCFIFPFILSSWLNLSTNYDILSFLLLFIFPFLFLTLRLGGRVLLIFTEGDLIIIEAGGKENLSIHEIENIEFFQDSGSRAPFVLKISQTDKSVRKFQVDKFRFQNPNKKLNVLKGIEHWKNIITEQKIPR
jgi:hypothetical protein